MARCKNCSAPLPANSGICRYCGSANDVDLRGLHEFTVAKPLSERPCPHCDIPLQTIDLQLEGRFYIERCKRCLGLFFDPGELELVLEKSVSPVFGIDYLAIDQVNQARRQTTAVRYVRCPVCRVLMNRVNFGARSGVVVDRCRDHGVWLDGGELRHLLEWRKAGGQLLQARAHQPPRQSGGQPVPLSRSASTWHLRGGRDETDLLANCAEFISRLFQ